MTPKDQRDEAFYDRMYEDTGNGDYHPFRDHETEFGWGIAHRPSRTIFGYVGEKSACFAVCAALNGHWEAAQIFLEHDPIPLEYFERFRKL